jgi:hypothetical protein
MGTPNLILSSCPMPVGDPTAGMVAGWLDDGVAHIAFGGRAVLYDGGIGILDENQWKQQYCDGLSS